MKAGKGAGKKGNELTIKKKRTREEVLASFTKKYKVGQVLRVPIAHGEGNYFTEPDALKRLEDNRQVLVRYVDEKGQTTDASNPNGSLHNIAGITNDKRNVFGLMPHPERASETALGSTDGKNMLLSIVESLS